MIKIIVFVLSAGLSVLTSFALNLDAAYMWAISIIGFTLAFMVGFALLFFITALIFSITAYNKNAPKHYSSFYRHIFNFYDQIVLSLFGVRFQFIGEEKIPHSNFLLVQNHLSNVDPMLANIVLKRYPLVFVAKASLFKLPFFGNIIRKIGFVKLQRKLCKEDAIEMERASLWLKDNECSIAVYPEGTRNKTYPNPYLLEFKPGAFSIAKKNEKPVVITSIKGTEKINHNLLFSVHDIVVEILDVIPGSEVASMTTDEISERARKLIEESMKSDVKHKGKRHLL